MVFHAPLYRNKAGNFILQPLFQERFVAIPTELRMGWPQAPYTLMHDREGYICARKTFVEEGDPTGYKWAMKYLNEDYQHWQALMRTTWFPPYVEIWKEELEAKLRAEAITRIREISLEGGPSSLPAARFLATLDKELRRPGRPSKQEIDKELKRNISALSMEKEDAERIGLKVVGGRDIVVQESPSEDS